MSFQFIPTGMRVAKKAPHSKLPPLWKTNCNEAPTNIRSHVQNWFPQMKLYTGLAQESLLGVPSHACSVRVLSSGAEVSATVKFAVQFHKIPTCKARTVQDERKPLTKRVNTAEGQKSGLRDEDCVSQAMPMSQMWKIYSPFGVEFGSVG